MTQAGVRPFVETPVELERKDMNTKGLTQREVTKTLLTTTRLSKESMGMRMQSVTSVMLTMKRMQTS